MSKQSPTCIATTSIDTSQALMNSPVGAAFLLGVAANPDIPLERFAEPRASFWLAANAMDFCDPHRDAGWPEVALREARAYARLAQQIVRHPAFKWWWEPVNLSAQAWCSPQMPNSPDPEKAFDPEAWRTPVANRDGVPDAMRQATSTMLDGSSSEWTTFALGVGERVCRFPLAVWHLRFLSQPRIWEIVGPQDWHRLCRRYPCRSEDGRLVPDWPKVAQEWDGVHLTLGGMLTTEQVLWEASGECTELRWWQCELTTWLNQLPVEGERLPGVPERHNDHDFRAFPYDQANLTRGPGSFRLT